MRRLRIAPFTSFAPGLIATSSLLASIPAFAQVVPQELTESEETQGTPVTPDLPFTRGWYGSLDIFDIVLRATFPCSGIGCAPGEVIHYHSSGSDPNFGITVGYRATRFLALQAGTIAPVSPGSGSDGTLNDKGTTANDPVEVHVSLRGDLPLTRQLSLFATYGVGYERVKFDTVETIDPLKHPGLPPTIDSHTTRAGFYRPATMGLALNCEGVGVRFEYQPPIGGAHDGLALSKVMGSIEIHW